MPCRKCPKLTYQVIYSVAKRPQSDEFGGWSSSVTYFNHSSYKPASAMDIFREGNAVIQIWYGQWSRGSLWSHFAADGTSSPLPSWVIFLTADNFRQKPRNTPVFLRFLCLNSRLR